MQRNPTGRHSANGFTLIELLVVIAIIGILMALMMAAIQSSREAARAQQCCNNLRQIAIASLNHESAHLHFPSGGWGASWTGDPDRGFGPSQPGGWVYNILEFLEQGDLHDSGAGLQDPEKRTAATRIIQQPLSLFHCPTRRLPQLYRNAEPYAQSNADPVEFVARCDYAINAGHTGSNSLPGGGPATLKEGDETFPWPPMSGFTGISFLRSQVRISQIVDGTSQTYLLGEKSLELRRYDSGLGLSDRGHLYIGFAPDTVRMTYDKASPIQDSGLNDWTRFGSAHVGRCFFAFCDGSVRPIGYDIDPKIHALNGNRKEGF